jgi:putative transposase
MYWHVEMIHREFWITMLAYNLIRSSIALAAKLYKKLPRAISFTSVCQYVLASWQELQSVRLSKVEKDYC